MADVDDVSILEQSSPDNSGKEFMIGFMENSIIKRKDFDIELFITTASSSKVLVRVTAPKTKYPHLNETLQVSNGEVKQLSISNKFRHIGTEFSSKGILITSTDEVVVYGINKEFYSTDGFLGLPTDVLGTKYFAATYAPATRYCLILIVGVHDNTNVNIKLGDNNGVRVIYGGITYGKGDSFEVKINRFSTFQIHSSGDLTGTCVTSNKTVSIFSGNIKTAIGRGKTQDHLVEQLVPVDRWGKRFLAMSTPDRTAGDIYRFIASERDTEIIVKFQTQGRRTTSDTLRLSLPGHWTYKWYDSNTLLSITSSKPISVLQYTVSQYNDLGDPSMMIIPPIEQYGADYTFTTPKYSQGSYFNYLLFVVRNSEKTWIEDKW
ncbi:hypothetical protein FSP39_024897 [Pinctada imbricata]|uniref:IgGFc-binding protein N-terminal domain-containing protein n=1 Tax=Pinctada imbricata TaxID=66713 RepID=A0AA89C123_PINIB|nr:hypothetical protein FSP39_024897 [Pinctada imbricata]